MKQTKKDTLKEMKEFIKSHKDVDDALFQRAVKGFAYKLGNVEIEKKDKEIKITKSVSYDRKGTKFESRTRTVYVNGEFKSSSSKLYINDKKVIKGFESYSGWYWFATEISDTQDGVIGGKVYGNDKIYYGYVQGFENEWGYFSEADIMRAKPKVWAIPMKNLHYSGKREIEENKDNISPRA
jgi:hypothetical protein